MVLLNIKSIEHKHVFEKKTFSFVSKDVSVFRRQVFSLFLFTNQIKRYFVLFSSNNYSFRFVVKSNREMNRLDDAKRRFLFYFR